MNLVGGGLTFLMTHGRKLADYNVRVQEASGHKNEAFFLLAIA